MATISKPRLIALLACPGLTMLAACADVSARKGPPERGDGGAPSRTVTESVRDSGAGRRGVSPDPWSDVRPGPGTSSGTYRGGSGATTSPGPLAPNATTIPTPRGTTFPLPGGTTMPTPGDPTSPNPPTTTTPSPGSSRF